MTRRPSHLIVPDCHAHPSYSNSRFTALGKLIADIRPDKIICLGDFADMPAFCTHDAVVEGKRYKKDFEAVIDAQERLFNPIVKATGYKPHLHMCYGNHEEPRILKVLAENPRLEGVIGLESLRYKDFGWQCHPFLEPHVEDGIAYAHYFAGGVAGRPISGDNIAKTLCNKLHTSAVQGHSHLLDRAIRPNALGHTIFGLSAGWFGNPEMVEGWNRSTHAMWWAGVILLEDVKDGFFKGYREITQEKIMRDYH